MLEYNSSYPFIHLVLDSQLLERSRSWALNRFQEKKLPIISAKSSQRTKWHLIVVNSVLMSYTNGRQDII